MSVTLIQEAKRKDEERPLRERINETRKLLDEAKKMLDLTIGSPYAYTPEMIGSVNHYTKDVKRLQAKLALLSRKTVIQLRERPLLSDGWWHC